MNIIYTLLAHLSRSGVRRRSQCSNIFFSETAWPIEAKFYVEPPWVGGTKFCLWHLGHMTRMAATPIIHVISPYFGGSSLFFAHFGENLPIWNFRISLYILYISLFGISDLPTKTLAFPSLINHSPYFETKISLFDFRDVSHV